jgi:hypothetical protein
VATPKRRVRHRLGPRFVFFSFGVLTNVYLFYLGNIGVYKGRGGSEER